MFTDDGDSFTFPHLIHRSEINDIKLYSVLCIRSLWIFIWHRKIDRDWERKMHMHKSSYYYISAAAAATGIAGILHFVLGG